MRKSIQVWQKVAGVVATIYCPKVAFEVTLFIQNFVMPGPLAILAVAFAVVMLACVFLLQEGYALANTLTMMLFVYSSISLVSAFSTTSVSGEIAALWALVALSCVPAVRYLLPAPDVEWRFLLLRFDAIRYAGVVWLFSILFVGSGGVFTSWNWIIPSFIILNVCIVNATYLEMSRAVEPFLTDDVPVPKSTPDGKTTVGWIRWIMAFAVGGSLIGWVVGTSDSVLLAFVTTVYVGLLLEEPPAVKVLTTELNAVLGSGAATTLHLIFMNNGLVQKLAPIHVLALIGYMSFCIFVIHTWIRGKRHFLSLSHILRRVGRADE